MLLQLAGFDVGPQAMPPTQRGLTGDLRLHPVESRYIDDISKGALRALENFKSFR